MKATIKPVSNFDVTVIQGALVIRTNGEKVTLKFDNRDEIEKVIKSLQELSEQFPIISNFNFNNASSEMLTNVTLHSNHSNKTVSDFAHNRASKSSDENNTHTKSLFGTDDMKKRDIADVARRFREAGFSPANAKSSAIDVLSMLGFIDESDKKCDGHCDGNCSCKSTDKVDNE